MNCGLFDTICQVATCPAFAGDLAHGSNKLRCAKLARLMQTEAMGVINGQMLQVISHYLMVLRQWEETIIITGIYKTELKLIYG